MKLGCVITFMVCLAGHPTCEAKERGKSDIVRENTPLLRRSKKLAPPNPKDVTNKETTPKPTFSKMFRQRKEGWCKEMNQLMRKNSLAIKKIDNAIVKVSKDLNMDPDEKNYHKIRFNIMKQELNETEEVILNSFDWLRETLNDDYNDIMNMKEGAKKRLEKLRDATLREEQEYNSLIKAEEQLKALNTTKVHGMVEEILQDVAEAADQLQEDLEDHVFDNAVKDPNMRNGANIEAVIRIEDEDPKESEDNNSTAKNKESAGVIKLVDVQENQFVLSKGKDSTIPHEDHHLITDVVYLILLSFIFGWLCSLIGMPSMFGYVLAGIILGPSGFNMLKSLVQIETIGEFGVFFILFSVGLEFSPDKIKKVFKVSVIGGTSMMMSMVLCGLAVGHLLQAKPNESAFVASCLSLSSTPLVVKFLTPHSESQGEESPSNTEYGTTLLGILIMQDVLLGILMALLPNMADSGVEADQGFSLYAMIGFRLICAMAAVLLIGWILSQLVIGLLFALIIKSGNKEIIVLASVSLAFAILEMTDYLQISMELGCFLAGVMISGQGPAVSEQIEHTVQPVKDFLGCIFFCSIGLHVFPSFMVYEMTYLVFFTILTVGFKFFISVAVLALILPRSSRSVKWIVSAGLAQVSEFSFVLGSRARRLGLISREVYLLVLSVTTLSLLLAPALWKAILWQLRVRQRRLRSSPSHGYDSSFAQAHLSPETSDTDDFVIVSHASQKPRRTLSK